MKKFNLFKQILFSSILLVIFILIIELCIQVFVFLQPVPIFFSNTYKQYQSAPESSYFGFKINSHGYKDLEFTPKKKDTYRIAAIGDSFTFGVVPYEDTFVTVTENLVRSNTNNQEIEILNMGIPSTSPQEYLEILSNEALALEPDMVLINFFVGNDYSEFYYSGRREFFKKYFKTGEILYFGYQLWTGLGKDFNLNSTSSREDYCDTCATMNEVKFMDIQKSRSYIYLKDYPKYISNFNHAMSKIAEINNICIKKNIRLVVNILPDESQLSLGMQQQLSQHLKTNYSDFEIDWLQPNHMLQSFLTSNQIPFIDSTNELSKYQSDSIFVPRDTHLNIYGNKLVGNYLANEIRQYIP